MIQKFKKIFRALSYGERVVFIGALCAAAVSFSMLMSVSVEQITNIVAAEGGDYTEGLVGQPTYVNPVTAITEIDKTIVRLVFSPVGDIAEKIEAENDGRVWRVRLRENLFWHDGEKFTSDDIIFTIQKIQDPDSRSPLAQSWQGVLPERLSEREIQFNLGVPYAFFSANLKNLYAIPKHLFLNIPPANWRISNLSLKPIGNGPYMFDAYEIQPNGFITSYRLRRNPNAMTLPFISRFDFKFLAAKSELLEAFTAGLIDGASGLDIEETERIGRPYRALYFRLPNYYAVFMNQNQHIALKEIAVRQALTLAIDRKTLVSDVFGNHARVVDGPLPAGPPYSGADGKIPSPSPEAARQLLERNDWKLGSRNIYEKTMKNAVIALEFNLAVPKVHFLLETAARLRDAWGAIGANVVLQEIDIEEILDPVIKNREYQAILFGNVLNSGADLFSFWHSSERFHPGLNLSLYNNKDVDRLIEEVRQNLDLENARQQLDILKHLIVDDVPAIFLYSPDYVYITGKDLKGVVTGLIHEPADRFSGAAEWYLKTKRIFK